MPQRLSIERTRPPRRTARAHGRTLYFGLIDRYILTRLLSFFGFFALVLITVYWINRAVRLFEQLLSDGQTALVVLEFTILTLPLVIAQILPLPAFAAGAYAIYRLEADSELAALRSTGVSPWQIARPVAVFGIIVAIMVAVLAHGLAPSARSRLADREADLAESVTAQFLQPGRFQSPADGLTIFIGEISQDGRLLDLLLQDARTETVLTYTSRSALLLKGASGPRLVMLDGMVEVERPGPNGPRLDVTRFADLVFDLADIAQRGSGAGHDLREWSTWHLIWPDVGMLTAAEATVAQSRLMAHERIMQPMVALAAALLGAVAMLFGSHSRTANWVPMAGATIAIFGLNLAINAATNAATADPSKWPLVYLPPVAGVLAVLAALRWLSRGRAGKRS